jgi:uncharacterized membrane protein YhiD involved in acid resistance
MESASFRLFAVSAGSFYVGVWFGIGAAHVLTALAASVFLLALAWYAPNILRWIAK